MKAVEVTVPGKMMISGEYSVLGGGRALAVSLDKRLSLRIGGHIGEGVGNTIVKSCLWPEPRTVDSTESASEYGDEPLLEAVHTCQNQYGICPEWIEVDSDLEVSHGVGTSSAVRLGVCKGFDVLAGGPHGNESWDVPRLAYVLQRAHQGRASGYDIATQYLGGAVVFRDESDKVKLWPSEIERPDVSLVEMMNSTFQVFTGGAGAPTKETMRSAYDWLAKRSNMKGLKSCNELLIQATLERVRMDGREGLDNLIKRVEEHRQFFSESPTFPRELGLKLGQHEELGRGWSYKTTGAGGEDALLVVARPEIKSDLVDFFADLEWAEMPKPFSLSGLEVREALS